jgi:acetyl-CoA synthetase
MKEIDFVYCRSRGITSTYGIIPLVSGITSIIDEAKFDANRWYSILEEQK